MVEELHVHGVHCYLRQLIFVSVLHGVEVQLASGFALHEAVVKIRMTLYRAQI